MRAALDIELAEQRNCLATALPSQPTSSPTMRQLAGGRAGGVVLFTAGRASLSAVSEVSS